MNGALVKVVPDGDRAWNILHEGKNTGRIVLTREGSSFWIHFEIEPAYRKKHYASAGLYILTPLIHESLHVSVIYARIDKSNEQAKHVLEHNGYEIVSTDGEKIIYSHALRKTVRDDAYHPDGKEVLYFAGGCFWGMERVFQMLEGVTDTKTGYANGHVDNPTYEQVCREDTGFREAVRVTYDPSVVSEETILDAFFLCIDPEQEDGQKGDTGEQYKTGVYYRNESLLPAIEKKFAEEKQKHKHVYTELKPLSCFYEAEEYHQNYLLKNPDGYCHITKVDLEKVRALNRHR